MNEMKIPNLENLVVFLFRGQKDKGRETNSACQRVDTVYKIAFRIWSGPAGHAFRSLTSDRIILPSRRLID